MVGELRVGIVVDQIVGTHQTVIRSLGTVYKKADCVCGATILGDGSVAMIWTWWGWFARTGPRNNCHSAE